MRFDEAIAGAPPAGGTATGHVRSFAPSILIAALIGFPVVSLIAASPQEPEAPKSTRNASDGSQKQWKIADQSCAASRCHGGYTADKHGRGGHEASVWGYYDPHAHAYDVLQSNAAKRMMTILASHDATLAKEAVQEVRCLACHSSPIDARPAKAAQFGDDGVSCRSCHGEASKWLVAHRNVGLGKVHDADARRQAYGNPAVAGLRFLGTSERRAATCVGCHVGAKDGVDGLPRREVDHDLIAAGHPRLVFDLATQSTREPRHWRDRPKPDLPAEWASGQVAAIKALTELAISRPGGATLDFADQSCVNCHRSLPNQLAGSPTEVHALGKPSWAPAYAPSIIWLSNGQEIANGLSELERAKRNELSAALNRLLETVASKPQSLNSGALPPLDAPLPVDRDALMAESSARLAVDPAGERLKKLKAALNESPKQPSANR